MEQAPRRGILVAIEGIDGAGKTTQASLLASRLAGAGLEVVRSKEPTDGPWGRAIRASAASGRMGPEEELAAFMADRRQHVEQLLEPSLARGAVVIVDRYYFSTAAYQGARGMAPEAILEQNERFAPQPDLLAIIEVEPAVGVERIRARGDVENLFEREDDLAKSAAIFAQLRRPYLLRVDGRGSPQAVNDQIVTGLVAGPLFRMLCATGGQDCTPEHCSRTFSGGCRFLSTVRLFPDQVRQGHQTLELAKRIAEDETIPPEQKAAALLGVLVP